MSALYVVFEVGGAEYVLPASEVEQLETWAGATPVPGTPPWVAGLVQIRGDVVPVVDLRTRFGLEGPSESPEQRVIVVRRGTTERGVPQLLGLKVDRAREVLPIDDEAFRAPPPITTGSSQWVAATVLLGERLCMRMDIDRVVEGGLDG